MKQEHIDKIKQMVGTEFIYVFEDGSEIPAIVAAFDPEVGITILATDLVDSHGDSHSLNVDSNGNYCLIGVSSKDFKRSVNISMVLYILRSVRCLGYYKVNSDDGFGYVAHGGLSYCPF